MYQFFIGNQKNTEITLLSGKHYLTPQNKHLLTSFSTTFRQIQIITKQFKIISHSSPNSLYFLSLALFALPKGFIYSNTRKKQTTHSLSNILLLNSFFLCIICFSCSPHLQNPTTASFFPPSLTYCSLQRIQEKKNEFFKVSHTHTFDASLTRQILLKQKTQISSSNIKKKFFRNN